MNFMSILMYFTESCSTQSGYEYEQSLHWCYRLVEGNKLNAAQAADFCRLDGARMIRIDSLERHHHLTDLLFSRNIDSAWIGGHSAKDDNTFVYEDGTPLSYFNWLTGSPCYEKYIRIRVVGNFLWENGFGTQPRDFLCER
ncbi:macrophage mannose receptor 1-like [Pecten maximus]|uniref:macrophage mannose receptor 1-like n=1 Tax=Pecten maximus TaxID=6579 RepID=UPI0014590638|nr:macrophage mannose receptor 1-like [Pecten maximus]